MTQEVRRHIRRASLLMAASVVLSRVIGFFREWVFAQQLGASAITDVYLSSFIIPDFLNYLMAAGALSVSFIPILSECLATQGQAQTERVFRSVSTLMGSFLLVLIVIAEIFAPTLGRMVAPGYNAEQLELLTYLLRIILPAQFFFYWGGLAISLQQTHGKFIYAAIAPIIYNLAIIVFGLGLHQTHGVTGFSIGVVVGSFLGQGVLQWWGLRQLKYSCLPSFDFSPEIQVAFKRYLWMTFPIMLGFSLVVTDEWISKYFASFMQPKAVSFLSYARTEMRIPIAIIGQAAGIASFPYLSRLWSQKKYTEYVDTLLHEISKLWALGPVAAALVVSQAGPITQFIYGGGRLSAEDLRHTANVLELLGLGIFFWTWQILLSRGFYAAQRTWLPSIIGTVLSVAFIPFYHYLGHHYSYYGLAFAGTVGIVVYCTILWVLLRAHLKKVAPDYNFAPFYLFVRRWLIAILLLTLLCFGWARYGFHPETRLSAFFEVFLCCLIVGGLTLGLLRGPYKKYTGDALF